MQLLTPQPKRQNGLVKFICNTLSLEPHETKMRNSNFVWAMKVREKIYGVVIASRPCWQLCMEQWMFFLKLRRGTKALTDWQKRGQIEDDTRRLTHLNCGASWRGEQEVYLAAQTSAISLQLAVSIRIITRVKITANRSEAWSNFHT